MFKNKETAESVSKLILEASAKIEASRACVYTNCNDDEWLKYGKATGEILGIICIDILNKIYREFPELKPDEYYLPPK